MSDWQPEEKERLIVALETIAGEKTQKSEEATIVSGMYGVFSVQLEQILDSANNEFNLRRDLRHLVRKLREQSNQ